MIELHTTIINKLGLHARAAARLVATASRFDCDIRAIHHDREANVKSIMAVMMLAAGRGTVLKLRFDGNDEQQAMAAVQSLINDRFGESE